jgi:hypothetical protein
MGGRSEFFGPVTHETDEPVCEAELARLVTRDSMIGVSRALSPRDG